MDEENLTDHNEGPMMEMSLYNDISETKLYSFTKTSSVETVNYIKANIRDVSLEDLVELVEIPIKIPVNELPELPPEKQVAIRKARLEIHRRAFKNFTVVPSRKFDGSELGTLRKPKQ